MLFLSAWAAVLPTVIGARSKGRRKRRPDHWTWAAATPVTRPLGRRRPYPLPTDFMLAAERNLGGVGTFAEELLGHLLLQILACPRIRRDSGGFRLIEHGLQLDPLLPRFL